MTMNTTISTKSYEDEGEDAGDGACECDHADEVLSIDALEELLPLTDFLVMVLPDSESTRDIVNLNINC